MNQKKKTISKIFSLTEDTEITHRILIESYSRLFDQYAQIVRIEKRQAYYNLNEKLNYYRVKLLAITIEISTLVSNERFDQLNDLLNMINLVLIEFFVRNLSIKHLSLIFENKIGIFFSKFFRI